MTRPLEVVRLMAQAVDAHGAYFPGHSDGVAYLLRLMASEAGLEDEQVRRLQVAAMLHDVGKLMVPYAVLSLNRSLRPAEYDRVKQHSHDGADIVASLGYAAEEGYDRWPVSDVAPWVRHVHERYDGDGYPDGLIGDEIPWESRMIAVADAVQVMTSNRPYQRSRTGAEALTELQECSGTQFDPSCVEILVRRGGDLHHSRLQPT